MNAAAYRACFDEIAKEASLTSTIAQRSARAGDAMLRFGGDAAHATVNTFRPSAWREGADAISKARLRDKLLFGVPTAVDAAVTLSSNTDPRTGRHIGAAERVGLAASHIGAGLAGYTMGGGLLRGAAIGTAAGLAADKVVSTVARPVDRMLGSGAAPPARGVV